MGAQGSQCGGMLCREILEGFRKTEDPFAPAPFPRPLGAGVLRKFGADFFVFFFWLPSSGKPECAKRVFAMCETVFAQILGAQIFAQIQVLGAQIFLRRLAIEKWVCAENLRKNLRRPHGPVPGGTPFHLRFLEQTARHTIAARPTYSRRACEGPL